MLNIFVAITLEGWSNQMYYIMETAEPTIAVIYYLLLILFGSFILINLTLAVIMSKFREAWSEVEEEVKKRAEAAVEASLALPGRRKKSIMRQLQEAETFQSSLQAEKEALDKLKHRQAQRKMTKASRASSKRSMKSLGGIMGAGVTGGNRRSSTARSSVDSSSKNAPFGVSPRSTPNTAARRLPGSEVLPAEEKETSFDGPAVVAGDGAAQDRQPR